MTYLENQSERTDKVPVKLDDETIFQIEVIAQGREDTALGLKSFESIGRSIEGIVRSLYIPIQKVKPSKATVKFGLEIGIEQGTLVAAIVRGTGKSNLEITLEWRKEGAEGDENESGAE